jgi:hypothetical protein
MALKARDLYASSNGDRWSLVRDAVNQEVCVKHEPNAASGGKPSYIPIGEFLRHAAHGPEHTALMHLIGTLVDNDSAHPSEPARRQTGQEAVLPASSVNPAAEMGRQGGQAGTETLSSGQRAEQSRAAAMNRWDTKRS